MQLGGMCRAQWSPRLETLQTLKNSSLKNGQNASISLQSNSDGLQTGTLFMTNRFPFLVFNAPRRSCTLRVERMECSLSPIVSNTFLCSETRGNTLTRCFIVAFCCVEFNVSLGISSCSRAVELFPFPKETLRKTISWSRLALKLLGISFALQYINRIRDILLNALRARS